MSDSAASEMKDASGAVKNWASQFSKTRLTTAAVFAFLPFFGVYGIHDFILKQYKKGVAHIAMILAGGVLYSMTSMTCSRGSNCYNLNTPALFLQGFLQIASYIWAVVEGVQILRIRKQKVIALSAANNSDAAQSSEAAMEAKQKQAKDYRKWAKWSIVFTMIPIVLWVTCLIISGGDGSENGPGMVWWFMVMYYWSFGVPLAILSIIFGIMGLKSDLRWLSIVSLLIKTVVITIAFVKVIIPIWIANNG